jgi:outer membrane protein TolC
MDRHPPAIFSVKLPCHAHDAARASSLFSSRRRLPLVEDAVRQKIGAMKQHVLSPRSTVLLQRSRALLTGSAVACMQTTAFAAEPSLASAPKRVAQAETGQAETPRTPLASAASALARVPMDVNAEVAGREAMRTSFSLKAQRENIQAAAARVDQAWANFLPQLSLTARYTRLSAINNPPISLGGGGPGGVLFTQDPPGTANPRVEVGPQPAPLVFPVILDNFLLQGQIAVPVSDYFLRINQGYSAATKAADGARYDAIAAGAKSYTEGKLAYYNFMRAKGALVVTELVLADVRTRAADVKAQESVGNASRADSLRVDTAVAAAELQVERTKNLVALTEKQLRLALHVPEGTQLVAKEDLSITPPKSKEPDAETLITEAMTNRPELKSIEANLNALKSQSKATAAAAYPSLSLFGDLQVANPNQRIFPQTPEFRATWAAGVQATWSPNDFFRSSPAAKETDLRVSSVEAQREQLKDGIRLEVTQTEQQIRESEAAIASTEKSKESATEALRVARELFRNGRATATLVTDAETEMARARLENLNAHVDVYVARVRLDHALGRSAKNVLEAPR